MMEKEPQALKAEHDKIAEEDKKMMMEDAAKAGEN